MINAYLDGNELKMFPDIAIGLTIENFNISDLSNRKIDRTNIIRIPKAGNEIVLEFSSAPNAPTDFPYNDFAFDLIIDGMFIYQNGRAFIIGEDQKSYTLNVTNNKNIIDLLKSINLADLYTGDTVTLINTTTWRDLFAVKTNGFRLDYLWEESQTPGTDAFGVAAGQRFLCIYLDTILAKIETDFAISFSGNLLSESDFLEMRMPVAVWNLKRNNGSVDIYVDDLIIHDSLTAWDLVKNILQLFCAVFKIDGTDMELQKFNDLDIATPLDWSGKLVSSSKKFSIPNIAQQNFIKYSIAEDVDELLNSALIECNNTNIDFTKDIATMKSKLKPFRDINQYYTNASTAPLFAIIMPDIDFDFPGLPTDPTPILVKGLKDFLIFVDSAEFLGQPLAVSLQYYHESAPPNWTNPILNGNITADNFTEIVKYYDPSPNYSLIETMLTDPVFYEAELNLNIIDINAFDHLKAVKIDELEGVFYVNKILNFLATSPGTPTKVELIKIS